MTFDLQAAREIAAKCLSKDDNIDHDYWNAMAAQVLPETCEEIARLQKENMELDIALKFGSDQISAHQGCIIEDQAARIKQLEAERNEAQKNYQWMVDNAAKTKLDGYRELGQKAADAENKLDVANDRIKQLEAQLIRERERYIDDFVHEFDEYEDRSEEAREQLQAEDKL